jgi:hypothetical protein
MQPSVKCRRELGGHPEPSAPKHLKRAPDRVVAAVPAQPVGFRPEMPTVLYDNGMTNWGPELVKRRPEVTMEMVNKFPPRGLAKNNRLHDPICSHRLSMSRER